MRKRVLVFDSGVGGLSVLDAIVAAGAPVDLDYLADNAWLPYGDKTDDALRARVPALVAAAARDLASDCVVIACNTASTIALEAVRAAIAIPVIGVVPPVKPAVAASTTRAIGLLATPATIGRPYVDDLIGRFASGVDVRRVGTTALVDAAERKLAGETPSAQAIDEAIAALFAGEIGTRIDVVALACTHFPLLRDELAGAAPRAVLWLDSGSAIARRVCDVLSLQQDGSARLRRAAFTHRDLAGAQWRAFAARGFSVASAVADAPNFEVRPIGDVGHA
jgi:glutamate racemase